MPLIEPTIECRFCNKKLPPGKVYCKNCKQYNWDFPTDQDDNGKDFVRLSDARVSEVERIPTLSPEMDTFFGGGIVRTGCYLFGGKPGAGKTTVMLQIAECFIKRYDRDVLYVANEQSAAEIRETALRIGITRLQNIVLVKAMGGLQRNFWDYFEEFQPCLSITDSLTKLVGDDMSLAVKVAEDLKALSVEKLAPSLIINQVTKGEEHAGLNKLQHAVDCTALLYRRKKKDVYWVADKNRFGIAPRCLRLEMTPTGLVPKALDEEEDDDGEEEIEGGTD